MVDTKPWHIHIVTELTILEMTEKEILKDVFDIISVH